MNTSLVRRILPPLLDLAGGLLASAVFLLGPVAVKILLDPL